VIKLNYFLEKQKSILKIKKEKNIEKKINGAGVGDALPRDAYNLSAHSPKRKEDSVQENDKTTEEILLTDNKKDDNSLCLNLDNVSCSNEVKQTEIPKVIFGYQIFYSSCL